MNIAWIIIIVVVMLMVQGTFFRKFAPRKLSYERYFNVSACYEGEQVEMVERIANRKAVPVPWLRLESMLSANLKFMRQQGHTIREGEMFQNHRSLFSLMPYTQVVRRHKITCVRRGYYKLDSATLTIGDLFSVFSVYRKLTLDLHLTVYPKPILPENVQLPSHSWQGDFTVRRWIVDDPFMLAGVREYQYGDSMRDVNWKATAKTGNLQVNQRDFTADRRLMVYLNVEDHEKMWNHVMDDQLIEQGIRYAAGFIQEAIHAGMEAGFATNAFVSGAEKEPVRIEPASGRGHFEYILGQMARLYIGRSVSFDLLLEQECQRKVANLDIIIITTYMNDKLRRLTEQLMLGGNALEILPLKRSMIEGYGLDGRANGAEHTDRSGGQSAGVDEDEQDDAEAGANGEDHASAASAKDKVKAGSNVKKKSGARSGVSV